MNKRKTSIVTTDMYHCYICGLPRVELHHIYFGTANRKISDKNRFVVPLCPEHHRGIFGAHGNRQTDLNLKRICQRKYEEKHSREEFRSLIGKSYL